jgi:hypothetical protein
MPNLFTKLIIEPGTRGVRVISSRLPSPCLHEPASPAIPPRVRTIDPVT